MIGAYIYSKNSGRVLNNDVYKTQAMTLGFYLSTVSNFDLYEHSFDKKEVQPIKTWCS